MPHGASGSVHNRLTGLWIDDPHSNDPPKEPLMRISQFLFPQSLQFFVIEKGLNPEVVIHAKSLELLGQREVCEDHVMDLSRSNQSSSKEDQICFDIPVVPTGSHLQTSLEKA